MQAGSILLSVTRPAFAKNCTGANRSWANSGPDGEQFMKKSVLLSILFTCLLTGAANAADADGNTLSRLNSLAHSDWQYLACVADHDACHHLAGHNGYHHALAQGDHHCLDHDHHTPYACYGKN
jgi:hypothetical protein